MPLLKSSHSIKALKLYYRDIFDAMFAVKHSAGDVIIQQGMTSVTQLTLLIYMYVHSTECGQKKELNNLTHSHTHKVCIE